MVVCIADCFEENKNPFGLLPDIVDVYQREQSCLLLASFKYAKCSSDFWFYSAGFQHSHTLSVCDFYNI
jgi:hypothetical protein